VYISENQQAYRKSNLGRLQLCAYGSEQVE